MLLELEIGSTRSPSLENSLWECCGTVVRQTAPEMNIIFKQSINLNLTKYYEFYSFVIGPSLFTYNVQCCTFSCQD
jgi:hypothetical protein